MHTLHFLLIFADSAADAADSAHAEIADWGNEDNWRRIGGIASEDGLDDVENAEGARWGLSFLDPNEPTPQSGTAFERAVAYPLSAWPGSCPQQRCCPPLCFGPSGAGASRTRINEGQRPR